jgi:hypothetical protein
MAETYQQFLSEFSILDLSTICQAEIDNLVFAETDPETGQWTCSRLPLYEPEVAEMSSNPEPVAFEVVGRLGDEYSIAMAPDLDEEDDKELMGAHWYLEAEGRTPT